MAMQPRPNLFNLLGFVYWGDIGELTLYKSQRNKLVYFVKTYPDSPPSPLQSAQREKLKTAARAWNALMPEERAAYEQATKRTSICLTGYNLWVWASLGGDLKVLTTIARQSDQTLTPPTT